MFSRSMGQKEVPKYRVIFHWKAEKALVALDEKMKHRLAEQLLDEMKR
jgi:hypothetical protein